MRRKLQAVLLATTTIIGTLTPVNTGALVSDVNAEELVAIGDFLISDCEGYSYKNGVLSIYEDGDYTIMHGEEIDINTDYIRDYITVEPGVTANLTFGDIKIYGGEYLPALYINDATVNLKLLDESSIYLSSGQVPGIVVSDDSKLYIEGNGKLEARSFTNTAIGGDPYVNGNLGEVTINSGEIEAVGQDKGGGIGGSILWVYPEGSEKYGASGKITVNGGSLLAQSAIGSAIGGCFSSTEADGGDGGELIVNGGKIEAIAGKGTAIGGGYSEEGNGGAGTDITINGGSVIATTGVSGTAVGGGWSNKGNGGDGGSLTINDGEFKAGTYLGTGIGGGHSISGTPGKGTSIVVNGGSLEASSVEGCSVGGGCRYDSQSQTQSKFVPTNTGASFVINDGTVYILSSHGMSVCCEELIVCGGETSIFNPIAEGTVVAEGDITNVTIKPAQGKQIVAQEIDNSNGEIFEIEGSPFKTETNYSKCLNGRLYSFTTENAESDIKVGFIGSQISTTAEGFRVIYSVEGSEEDVVEKGLIYGLADYCGKSDMILGSTDDEVHYFESTAAGKSQNNIGENKSAYIMTMNFIKTKDFFQAPIYVRAYAKTVDGSIVYSDVKQLSVYKLASYLYDRGMMNNYVAHDYLYDNILSVVDQTYERKDYDWLHTIVGFESMDK